METRKTFIGSVCKHGHFGERYVRGSACVDCLRDRKRARTLSGANRIPRDQWKKRPKKVKTEAEQLAYREKRNAARRLARANDPTYRERANGWQRTFDERNREQENARKLAWQKANPAFHKAQRHRRRGLERQALGHHTGHDLARILTWQGGRCAYCDSSTDLHVDHVVPLARGGSNWPWNLQYLCAFHNISKGAKTDAEYRAFAGLPPGQPISMALWCAALAIYA